MATLRSNSKENRRWEQKNMLPPFARKLRFKNWFDRITARNRPQTVASNSQHRHNQNFLANTMDRIELWKASAIMAARRSVIFPAISQKHLALTGKILGFTGYFPPKPPNQEFLARLRAFPSSFNTLRH